MGHHLVGSFFGQSYLDLVHSYNTKKGLSMMFYRAVDMCLSQNRATKNRRIYRCFQSKFFQAEYTTLLDNPCCYIQDKVMIPFFSCDSFDKALICKRILFPIGNIRMLFFS